MSAIFERHSARKFLPKPVEQEKITQKFTTAHTDMRCVQRTFLVAALFFIATALVTAEPMREAPLTSSSMKAPEQVGELVPFPIAPLLIATEQRNISWRPDWDMAIPVDAFVVAATRSLPRSITLALDGAAYRVAWNQNGSLTAFPFLLNNTLTQVVVMASNDRKVAGFRIGAALSGEKAGAGDNLAWELRFIGDKANPQARARVTDGGELVYFVALQFEIGGISETWYDEAGAVLALFSSSVSSGELRALDSRFETGDATEQYEYDSFGNVTETNSVRGRFSAVYSETQQPRYWETLEGATRWHYSLQWDAGRLVRLTGVEGPLVVEAGADTDENALADNGVAIDLRYDYTLDARGNWIERRETRMTRRLEALVPTGESKIAKRIIEYGADL
jgi:YD repeat-containing protein